MDAQEFKDCAKAAVDFIVDYIENLRDRQVLPSVEPGYLHSLLPQDPPQNGEPWQDILKDVEEKIAPGLTHWQSPNFHAYFPTGQSYASIIGEMLSAGFGVIGFSWQASPSCTELEVIMMDWLAKLLGLPEHFLHSSEGRGGGIIQSTASETTFVSLLTAKEKKVREMLNENPSLTEGEIKAKLVAYSSDQSNSSVEKAGMMASIPMRLLTADENGCLRGETLLEAIRKDKAEGLYPCIVVATLGTTGIASSDNLEELGPICQKENIWLHVDAAYAGAAFVCPEHRYLMKGIEMVDSFNFNPHKWMLVNFDCSAFWVRDQKPIVEAFNVDRIYLKHKYQDIAPDYRHWQIPLGRKMRALKLLFVLRSYGVEGLQKFIRSHCDLAKYFAALVESDSNFELCTVNLSLVTFRLKGDCTLTQNLLENITSRKNIYIIPCHYREKYVIRFAVGTRLTEKCDIDKAWNEIKSQADLILKSNSTNIITDTKISTINIDTNEATNITEKSK